eukprot:6729113-Heterocapsa_arctica.AAC.1
METKREKVSNKKYRRASVRARTPVPALAGCRAAWLPRSLLPAWPVRPAGGVHFWVCRPLEPDTQVVANPSVRRRRAAGAGQG